MILSGVMDSSVHAPTFLLSPPLPSPLHSASAINRRGTLKKSIKMTIFPLDENDLPSYKTSLGFFTALGAGTVIWANLIHNLPFYNRTERQIRWNGR